MVLFGRLWENFQNSKDAEHIDTEAMKAIRVGNTVRENFWEDFLQVCNNAEAVAELLGVRPEQVIGWGPKIKHNLERVGRADDAGEGEEKTKVLDTGKMGI